MFSEYILLFFLLLTIITHSKILHLQDPFTNYLTTFTTIQSQIPLVDQKFNASVASVSMIKSPTQ